MVSRIRVLEERRKKVHAAITDLYWTFTRTARGKPPCVVAPELYAERAQIDLELATLRRRRYVGAR